MKKSFIFIAAALLLICVSVCALSEGGIVVTDTSGITNTGTTSTSDSSSGASTGVTYNPDGSITVESGTLGTDYEEGSEGSSGGGLTQEEWEARMNKAQNRNGLTTDTWLLGPEKDPVPVTIEYMGLARSMVNVYGVSILVNTCDLIWDTDAPDDKVLAVIDANRVGYANLREKTSQKSFIMDHCITNKVVRVLSTGKTWSMVDYDGMRGYVLTAALEFHPLSMRGYTTGKISINGRTKGKSPINIRANPKNGSRILGGYVVGTPLTIFSVGEKWCEVDVEGWHCYILTEYVTLDDPSALKASN